FVIFKPLLLGRGEPPVPLSHGRETLLYVTGFAAVAVIWLLIQYQALVGWLLMVAGVVLIAYVLFVAILRLTPHDRDRIFAAMLLIFGSILFWALFEQAGSSLNLFTDRHVD